MLKIHWIAGAAMISLGSLAFAQQQQLGPREAAVDGTSVVFSAAAAAGAQGRAFDSTPSRTDVKAELAQARANGELNGMREWAIDGTSAITTRSAPAGARGRAFTAEPGLTRAQVRAELDHARASGEMERFMSQHGGGN